MGVIAQTQASIKSQTQPSMSQTTQSANYIIQHRGGPVVEKWRQVLKEYQDQTNTYNIFENFTMNVKYFTYNKEDESESEDESEGEDNLETDWGSDTEDSDCEDSIISILSDTQELLTTEADAFEVSSDSITSTFSPDAQLVAPKNQLARPIEQYHTSNIFAHLEASRIYIKLPEKHCWSGTTQDTRAYIAKYSERQTSRTKSPEYLIPLETISPFQEVAINVMKPNYINQTKRSYSAAGMDYFTESIERKFIKHRVRKKVRLKGIIA